jgi:hypothetical protein
MDVNGSVLGLGYHSWPDDHDKQGASNNALSDTQDDTAALMKTYLAQCIDYHNEKECERQNAKSSLVSVLPNAVINSNVPEVYTFPSSLSSLAPGIAPNTLDKSEEAHVINNSYSSDHRLSEHSDPEQAISISRSRAQAILDRFRQQQEQLLWIQAPVPALPADPTGDNPSTISINGHPSMSYSHHQLQQSNVMMMQPPPQLHQHYNVAAQVSSIEPHHYDATNVNDMGHLPDVIDRDSIATPTPEEPLLFRQQRLIGLRQESQRKHLAMLRNLEYVAMHEDMKIQSLQSQATLARTREDAHRQQASFAIKLRTQYAASHAAAIAATTSTTNFVSSAGIGTKKRRKVERQKEREGHVARGAAVKNDTENGTKLRKDTVAVYVSGLIVPITNDADTIQLLNDLFGSYGEVVRVHLYRDKQKPDKPYKGDGLIIFRYPSLESNASDMLTNVCIQVRLITLRLEAMEFVSIVVCCSTLDIRTHRCPDERCRVARWVSVVRSTVGYT